MASYSYSLETSPLLETKIKELKKVLLPLIELAGGEIQRINTIQLALFYLKDSYLPNFSYDSQSIWGPRDPDIDYILTFLCGFIHVRIRTLEDGRSFPIFTLEEQGKLYAKIYLEKIKSDDIDKYNLLKSVAKSITDTPTQTSLIPLLNNLQLINNN